MIPRSQSGCMRPTLLGALDLPQEDKGNMTEAYFNVPPFYMLSDRMPSSHASRQNTDLHNVETMERDGLSMDPTPTLDSLLQYLFDRASPLKCDWGWAR